MACFQYSRLSQRKRLLFRVVCDILCIIFVATGICAVRFSVQPYHRGFFCDDESIQHPVLSDTISMSVAASVGIFLPLITIFVLEFSLRKNNKSCIITIKKTNAKDRSWVGACYNTIAVFFFGMAVNEFLTEVGKMSIGRLRPHFLTLCQPDMSKINCSAGYITEYVCTTSNEKLKEARFSFPSGHSSFSMYCMVFLILYLQARFSCRSALLLKPVAQLILFSMGFYTCLSRVSDYKHHWSDVMFGALLGMVMAVSVILTLADFGQGLWCCRETHPSAESNSLVPSREQTIEEVSETPYYSRGHPKISSEAANSIRPESSSSGSQKNRKVQEKPS